MKKTSRDQQRQRLYDWERARVCEMMPVMKQRFDSLEDCANLVCELLRLTGRVDQSLETRINSGAACRRARGSSWKMQFPAWTRNAWIISHEVAHAWWVYDGAHGPTYCRIYAKVLVACERHLAGASTVTEGQIVNDMRKHGRLKVAAKCPVKKRIPKSQWTHRTERIDTHNLRLCMARKS